MTGQVKEDFISRILELGVHVKNGQIVFSTSLFNDQEMLNHEEKFVYYDIANEKKQIEMHAGQLGFTYCKVPVIYTSAEKSQIEITFKNGETKVIPNNTIDRETSASIFNRNGKVERIDFSIERK
ncbi:hypothetical protein CEJ86_33775, partial [Sinorhizobium meliloti]